MDNEIEELFSRSDSTQLNKPKNKPTSSRWFPTRSQLAHLPKVLSAKERIIFIISLIVALLSFIAIPVSAYYHYTMPTPTSGGTLNEGIIGSPNSINPLLVQNNGADNDIINLVYSGLLKYNNQGTLIPDLAQTYQVSEDGLKYTFTLYENAMWHDGTPVTTDDVAFTILTAQDSDFQSPQRLNWQGIDVNIIDSRTIEFKLKNPYAQFLNNTTLGIIPKHLWENISADLFSTSNLNHYAIGSGPYKIDSINPEQQTSPIEAIKLKSFNNYHLGRSLISNVNIIFFNNPEDLINAYNQGTINSFSIPSPSLLSEIEKLNHALQPIKQSRFFSIFFNENNNNFLADNNARKALIHATNKKSIIDNILQGYGTEVESPLLDGILQISTPQTKYPFDRELAQKLLDDVDKHTSPTIILTTLDLLYLPDVAKNIQAQWQSVGVDVQIRLLSIPEMNRAIKDRDYEALLFGLAYATDVDPFSFWHSSQTRDPGQNIALYNNRNADAILERARTVLDDESRNKEYANLQEIILKSAPVLFLYSPDYLYIQSSNIKNNDINLIATPSNRLSTITNWYMNTKRTF